MHALVKSLQTEAVGLSVRSLFWLAASLSVLLSLWTAYAQFVPNPDAMFYLRSAELFASGRWHEGLEVFRWPLYSLGIASVMTLTGTSALVAAQVLNSILDAATAGLFIALVMRLAPDNRHIGLWAAFFILLHPKLVQLRPVIIRDHGFYTFLLLALNLVLLDLRSQRLIGKLAIAVSVALATLFRPEAAAFFLLIPAFYLYERAPSRARRMAIVASVLLIFGLLVPAYSLWNFMGAYSGASASDMLDTWSRLTRDMFQTLRTVSSQLETILPQGRNVGTLAYAGIVLAITIDVLLRALTIPVAVLAGLAFVPRRVLPEFAGRFLGWFALWQLPLLLMFMTFALFLDWRYAMGIALLAGMPAVFTLEAIASDAWAGSWRHKVLLVAAVAAVAIPFGLAVPRLSNLAYVRDAGIWVRDSLPPNAMVLTNDARIAYYSGRTYQQQVKAVPFFRLKDNLADANYLALHVERGTPPTIDGVDQSKPVATLHGAGERQVIVYHLR